MTLDETLTQLEALGTDKMRAQNAQLVIGLDLLRQHPDVAEPDDTVHVRGDRGGAYAVPGDPGVAGGGGSPPAILITLVLLGLVSAVGGLMLIRRRFAFLRQEPRRQRRLAVAVWLIHRLALLAWFVTFLILEGGP